MARDHSCTSIDHCNDLIEKIIKLVGKEIEVMEIDKFKDEALGWAWNRIANEGHYTGDGSHNNSDGFGTRISPALRPTADIIYSNLTAQSEAENQASIQKRRRWSNLQRKQQAAILEYSFTERAHREGAQTE